MTMSERDLRILSDLEHDLLTPSVAAERRRPRPQPLIVVIGMLAGCLLPVVGSLLPDPGFVLAGVTGFAVLTWSLHAAARNLQRALLARPRGGRRLSPLRRWPL